MHIDTILLIAIWLIYKGQFSFQVIRHFGRAAAHVWLELSRVRRGRVADVAPHWIFLSEAETKCMLQRVQEQGWKLLSSSQSQELGQ